MHQQVDLLIKGVPIRAEIRCDFGNCVRFQFYDESHSLLASGYKSINLGIDKYPEKRIAQRGLEEVLEAAEWLLKAKPEVVKAFPVVSNSDDLRRFAKWREFLSNPQVFDKKSIRFDEPTEPIQLTLF